jgi:hypothetical protein
MYIMYVTEVLRLSQSQPQQNKQIRVFISHRRFQGIPLRNVIYTNLTLTVNFFGYI